MQEYGIKYYVCIDVLYIKIISDIGTSYCTCVCVCVCVSACIYIQGVSRLWDITAGGDFLGLCDEKSSYKHVSDFGRLRSYGRFLIPVHALV